jgi:hypothetical protein
MKTASEKFEVLSCHGVRCDAKPNLVTFLMRVRIGWNVRTFVLSNETPPAVEYLPGGRSIVCDDAMASKLQTYLGQRLMRINRRRAAKVR